MKLHLTLLLAQIALLALLIAMRRANPPLEERVATALQRHRALLEETMMPEPSWLTAELERAIAPEPSKPPPFTPIPRFPLTTGRTLQERAAQMGIPNLQTVTSLLISDARAPGRVLKVTREGGGVDVYQLDADGRVRS